MLVDGLEINSPPSSDVTSYDRVRLRVMLVDVTSFDKVWRKGARNQGSECEPHCDSVLRVKETDDPVLCSVWAKQSQSPQGMCHIKYQWHLFILLYIWLELDFLQISIDVKPQFWLIHLRGRTIAVCKVSRKCTGTSWHSIWDAMHKTRSGMH